MAAPSKKSDSGGNARYNPAGTRAGGSFGVENTDTVVPEVLFYCLIFISLSLPNIIFSGTGWFDTLHIMKWVFAMAPIALISLIGGARLLVLGPERTSFKLDLFGLIWLLMLGYISVQPLWTEISSYSTYMKEWFFFATMIAAYIFTYNVFCDRGMHKLILWAANINAALNVVFAELLIRGLNGPFPFIMNVPGNYIGNTGQQEMFGLWLAMALMNGGYLHVDFRRLDYSRLRGRLLEAANLLLLAVNAWGLWNSTARGGILSFAVGITALAVIVFRTDDRSKLKRIFCVVAIILAMLLATLVAGKFAGVGRSSSLVGKMQDMVENTSKVGNRMDIWRSSWAVFMSHPVRGVGIGQFKWHYLEGQRIAFKNYPNMKWQYTHWAHNEYIQWLAEFGILGGLLLFVTAAWWLWNFARAMTNRKKLSSEVAWACSMIFLILFDAIFSRPFHRIENALWLSFAFALANRELLPLCYDWSEIRHSSIYRAIGLFSAAMACAGLLFLWSGLLGDQYLRRAALSDDIALKERFLEKARRVPMSRDEAEEQYAYHLLLLARRSDRPEDWDKAINQLYKSFRIRPNGKQLIELIKLAQQTDNKLLLSLLVPYLSPGLSNPQSSDGSAP